MTQLIKFTPAPDLEPDEKPVIQAARAPKIKTHEQGFVKSQVKSIIERAYFELGHALDKEKTAVIITSIIADIQHTYSFLSIEDIRLCIYYGTRGEYGDFTFLNVKTFHDWLKRYMQGTRREALAKQKRYEDDLLTEKLSGERTDEQKDAIHWLFIQSMVDQYEQFCKSGNYEVLDPAGKFYDYLKRIGLINFSEDRKGKILDEARSSFKRQNNPIKGGNDEVRISTLKSLVSKAIQKSDEKVEAEIYLEAKNIGLKIFLTDCRQMEVNLLELIEERLKELP